MPERQATISEGTAVLTIPECERRLSAGGVGILALAGVAAPVLRPANFAYHEGSVILRTGEGQILESARFNEPASFVICEVDRFEHTGFSVVVTGRLTEPAAVDALSDLPLRPWARAEKHHLVVLAIDEISGRRIAGIGESDPS